MNKSTQILVATMGSLVGLIGIEHGVGEMLQGSAIPNGIMILSWPNTPAFEILAGEPAITIIPNLLITGILANLFSFAYLVWAVGFTHRKNAGLGLIFLSIPMLLFGGGVFPPVFGLLIGAFATQVYAPLDDWWRRLPKNVRGMLGGLWPWIFGACILSWLSMFPGMVILSGLSGDVNPNLIFRILACMFGFLFLAVVAGLARDAGSAAPRSQKSLKEAADTS